jgi:hypothetical protein
VEASARVLFYFGTVADHTGTSGRLRAWVYSV